MSSTLEFALTAAAIVVIPIVLYLLTCWTGSRHRENCPRCGAKKLRCIQSILATVKIDGKRAPDHWSYYECEACHSRWKEYHGELTTVSDDEWEQYCAFEQDE